MKRKSLHRVLTQKTSIFPDCWSYLYKVQDNDDVSNKPLSRTGSFCLQDFVTFSLALPTVFEFFDMKKFLTSLKCP